MDRTLVIAEAGSCHDRSLQKAFALIDAAAAVGADACKFQWWSDPDALADRRRVPERYREIYRRYAYPAFWLGFLKSRCVDRGLEFMCTVYLPQDIPAIAPFVERFKVASFEAGDLAFLAAHPTLRNPMIISTGMLSDVDRFRLDSRVELLQCVSAYPAPAEAMNLRLLQDSGEPWDPTPSPFVGLSDHSRHPWMGALAVAAGAEIIEAHLRLEETDPQNPDYVTAFTPAEFADYVQNIRFAERVMGDGEKRLQPCEREMAQYRVGGATS